MFTGGVRVQEAEYAEFVSVYAGRLRRLAYHRCGDWDTADRLTRRVLLAVHRRWGSEEPPDAYAERTMDRLLRRHHGGFPADGPAPALAYTSADLIATGRARRRRMRAVTAAVTVVGLAAAGLGLYVLRPAPRGTPFLVEDCMDGLPSVAGGSSPSPSAPPSPSPDGSAGLDRLTALDGVLPLPGATVMPEQARREQLSCEVAAYFRAKVGPDGLERVELGLDDRGEPRPMAALLDPEIAPAALTVSVRVYTASGHGTVTISAAPTTLLPGPDHCARLDLCRLSGTTEDGRVVEQYGLHETPESAQAGHRLGADAEWWSVVAYSGHSMVLITITNTPDVRAALPASIQWAPLSEQVAALAADPRLAVFDPPAPSATATPSP